VTVGRKVSVKGVKGIRAATVAVLLTTFVGLQPATALAQGNGNAYGRRDRYEDRRDRREAQRDRQAQRREAQRDRWDRRDNYDNYYDNYYYQERGYWDAARYYRRDDRRYGPRRMGRYDRVYRGSDNRYYCRRDDGTTGLIVGGMAGGVLGNIIAPDGSRTLGTILGAGAGALIGRAIDDGDVVCR
jgi:hypothetical protein